MNPENRPNPDELLKAISKEADAEKKGQLKIFIGMAAGVGKTYAMLEEAQKLQAAGIDVRIGAIDTHQRIDTENLVTGLKIIPEKTVTYKDTVFKEMDLDEIIRVKPQVVLVDELAHSNIPGLRHEKRWQDVLEILDNDIDVYTTLNVQHIESLNDIVENIAGISIKETVPDLVIERAAFIQLVDLIPDELLKRLKEGKVYLGEQSKMASLNFFKADKLTALREILLRYTAEKVDHDLHHMVSTAEKETKWRPREKLLVAISQSPHSQKLIRTTRRLASNLEATWIAVFVETGKVLNESDEQMLNRNITLARDLGAEVITTHDPDVADAIQRIARRRGVTQIVVGRSPPGWFSFFTDRFNLLNKLAKKCTDIDIHVIRQEQQITTHKRKLTASFKSHQLNSYLAVFICVILFAALNSLALKIIGYQVVGEIFFIGILAFSLFFNKGPILFASFLFSIILYFSIIPNEFKTSPQSILLLFIYFITAVSTGILVDRYRKHQEMLLKREETSIALYRIIRQIATYYTDDKKFTGICTYLEKFFNTSFEIIVKNLQGGLEFNPTSTLVSNEKEKSEAIWVFENEREAGWSTDTLPSSENYYLPLKGFDETVGVLVCKKRKGKTFTLDEKNFLYTVSQQLGYQIERSFKEKRTTQDEMRAQRERINTSILKALSKEFKPVWKETKVSLKDFKKKLQVVNKDFLDKDFSKIEQAFNHLTKTIEHISTILDPKN